MKSVHWKLLVILLMVLLVIVGCSKDSGGDEGSAGDNEETADNEEEVENEANESAKDVLNIALDATPPTLDTPKTAATASRDTARLIFETLVITDEDFQPIPMLAEKIDVSDDNKTYTFHLRQGIKFHNGKEMIAEDVIASMQHWLELSSVSGELFKDATWEEEDEYTVVLELATPSPLTLDTLATSKSAPSIMPKEVIDEASADGVNEYIGTGPYQFVEWRQDQFIHFTRYDDYQPLEQEATGLGGKKVAHIKDIYFHLVPDSSTRLAGLQTGEYDFAYSIPYDNYEMLQDADHIDPLLIPGSNMVLKLNNVEGPVADPKIREAINHALDYDKILMGAFPNVDFYWLDSSYMHKDLPFWKSDAGSEHFNPNDPDKAKQLLEEAGYDGEEIRIMATRDYEYMYNMGVVIEEQLKQVGINAKLEIFDWPTMTEREKDTAVWDVLTMGISMVSTPPQLLMLSASWAGGVNDEHITSQIKEIETADSIEESRNLWEDLQLYSWEYLPIINFGGSNTLFGQSTSLEGVETPLGAIFWNAYFTE